MRKISLIVIILVLFLSKPAAVFALSHAYINLLRSSNITYAFLSQSVGYEVSRLDGEKFTGHGLTSSAGIEWNKFIQCYLAHTLFDWQSINHSFYQMNGSRISVGLNLVFNAPVVNLEIGGGFSATKSTLTKELLRGNYLGGGYFATLGFNYFPVSRVSVYTDLKLHSNQLDKNDNSMLPEVIRLQTSAAALGLRVWF